MRLDGTAVSGDRLGVMDEAEHERSFFPVSKIRVHATDTGHTFRRHWAIVSDDRNQIFSIVTEDYQLVSNARADELGRRVFALVFGKDAVAGLGLFNIIMLATRSWAHIDMTAESTAFEPRKGRSLAAVPARDQQLQPQPRARVHRRNLPVDLQERHDLR